MINKSDILFKEYISNLVDRIYKILPLYEEQNEGLFKNIQSLIYELNGLTHVIEGCLDSEYLTLLATLESLSDDALVMDDNKEVVRREVFKCINIVKKIGEKAIDESGDR
jgi:lipid II:glycine glycyltransferase (peptidoglycan interpeptide bridge formation enzyme)